MKQIIKYIFIIIVIATYFACDSDSNCGDNSADFARFNVVYVNEEGLEVDSSALYDLYYTPGTVVPDTLFISPIERKALDFSPAHDMLQYILLGFDEDSLVNRSDTIEITYRKINRVDSPDCPIDYSFTDLEVVYHTFDSAAVVNTFLNLQNNAPNIKFYIF